MPADLPQGPFREALELADKATFSQEELDAYQKVIDEIQQVRDLAEARWLEGEAAGSVKAKMDAVFAVLAARGISVGSEIRAHIEACNDTPTLDRWIARAVTAVSADEIVAARAESV